MKHKTNPGQCPIRPGREANMVRRIIQKCEGTKLSPASMAAVWRLLIGMSTAIESPLSLSVYSPDRDDALSALGREYFGPTASITRQPHIKRVIGDVLDGKTSVGIVPLLQRSDDSQWWTSLLDSGPNTPKIFAHVPFVYENVPGNEAPAALAIARIQPEATAQDISVIVLEADHNVSQHRLQTVFSKVGLEATWINIAMLSPANRHHLISVNSFVNADTPAMQAALAELGNSIIQSHFLGSYAVPVVLKPSVFQSPKDNASHA